MKKFTLLFAFLILLVFDGLTQNDNKGELDELLHFKKHDLLEDNSLNESSTLNLNTLKSNLNIDDYNNPPNWSDVSIYGGSGKDIARQIVVASDGSLYVVGSFSGDISIGSNNFTSVGRRDAFLAKFQNNGTFIWLKQFSPSENEKIDAFDIHLDASDNVYFTGYYTGSVAFGDFELANDHEMNLFVVKTNASGEVLLAETHNTANPKEIGLKVDTDNGGNIFVLGSTDGTTTYIHQSVILKYATEGNMLMEYYHQQCWADMQVSGEHIYFTGTFNSADYIGDFYLEPRLYNDAFVARSNIDLEFSWAKIAGHGDTGTGYSRGSDLFVDADENVYITGDFRLTLFWDDLQLNSIGGYVAKCTAEGNFIWATEEAENNFSINTPTDICVNNNYVFVSTYDLYDSGPEMQINMYNISNGTFWQYRNTESIVESMSCSNNGNTIFATLDADEEIQLSGMEANTLNNQWDLLFGGNSARAISLGMGIDQYDYLYNYGYVSNQINYYGQTIDKGLFLAKQDGNGNPVWVVRFTDADNVELFLGNRIVVDTISNCIYLTGSFFDPLVIPGGPTLIPYALGSIYLLKYDFNGNYLWSVQEDFKASNLCLATDYTGNVILGGTFTNTINIGGTQLVSDGWEDAFVAKFNSSGQAIWAVRAGGEDQEWSGLVSTDEQNNIYMTGEFDSYEVTVDDVPVSMEDGDGNILFAKFNPQGEVQWVTVKGGSTASPYADYYGWPTGIHTDPQGNTYIKGSHFDEAHFDDIVLSSSFDKPGYNRRWNKFVAKFDPDGNTIWANTISELEFSSDYNQFDVDQSGNVYTGLRVVDSIAFDSDYLYINSGMNDLVIARYSTNGELDWVKSIKDSENGSAMLTSVKCYNVNTSVVSGWFYDSLDFGTESFTVNNQNGFIGILDETIGITDYKKSDETELFSLFPNPAHSFVNIQFSNNIHENTLMTITDLAGKQVMSKLLNADQMNDKINLSGLSKGLYFLKLSADEKSTTKKLIVN